MGWFNHQPGVSFFNAVFFCSKGSWFGKRSRYSRYGSWFNAAWGCRRWMGNRWNQKQFQFPRDDLSNCWPLNFSSEFTPGILDVWKTILSYWVSVTFQGLCLTSSGYPTYLSRSIYLSICYLSSRDSGPVCLPSCIHGPSLEGEVLIYHHCRRRRRRRRRHHHHQHHHHHHHHHHHPRHCHHHHYLRKSKVCTAHTNPRKIPFCNHLHIWCN